MFFLADKMLGKLARWLRFLGFDTSYPEVLSDKELIELAKRENRILLTRDKEVSETNKVQTLYIKSEDVEDQIQQILQDLNLKPKSVLSRCSLCNTPLEEVSKNSVEGKVPEKVFEVQDKFWFCNRCKKFYWPGTHYENILKKIEKFGISNDS
jgi:uncharacterized protein with PIN domain